LGVEKMNEERGMSLEKAIKLYNSVGLESRNMGFFAKWVYDVYKQAYIPGTHPQYIETLAVDKTKLSIFAILVDDLADNIKIRKKELLEKALEIPYNDSKKYENDYLETTRKIWKEIINSIKNYPRYEEFKDIFFFDLDQFLNSIKYGYLANTMDLYNITECKIYSPHNMMIILYLDMDLMCHPSFKKDELKKVRPIFHHIQDIMHIGNALNTFPREIEELDLSSPVISIGLSEGVIKKDDIVRQPKQVLANLEYLVPYFKNRVEENFEKIEDIGFTVESIDFREFYPRLKKIWEGFLQRPEYWKIVETEETTKPIMPVISKNLFRRISTHIASRLTKL